MIVNQIKVIETLYNGYRFRSRLEARWAVFFDTIGIKYEYEKEGFDLNGVWYLPDFWIPDLNYYLEIKGQYPANSEKEKSKLLASQTGKYVFLAYGSIPNPDSIDENDIDFDMLAFPPSANHIDDEFGDYIGLTNGGIPWDSNNIFMQCDICGKVDVYAKCYNTMKNCCNEKGRLTCESYTNVGKAFLAARQARFEHCE